VLIILLIAAVVPTAAILALATDANVRVQESLASLKRVMNTLNGRSLAQLSQTDFDRLQYSVDDLTRNLDNAKQKTVFLRPLSSLRPDIATTLDALDAAQEVSKAAQDILAGIQPTLYFLIHSEKEKGPVSQLSSGERVVELLRLGQGRFISASDHLALAQTRIAALNLSSLSPELLLTIQELIRYHTQLQDINRILVDSADLLTKAFGLVEPEDYLILSQNSDELRPSGGYISTFGWMRVRRVRISDYGYSPTSPTSPNPPPDSLASELNIPAWWIQYKSPIYMAWDGSWYADFPSTARMAAWFYDKGENPRSPVGGVIGIDIYGFEYILQGLGSVTVPGYDETVTPETFRQVIYKIRTEGEGDVPHKKFLAALYKQILSDWQNVSQESSDQLFTSVLRALQEKHIMLYFQDDRLNEAVRLLGWSGAQIPARDHDYLMVADANLGNKSNRSITRQLTYDVEIKQDGSLQGRATVAYDYSAFVAVSDPGVNSKNYNDINYFNIMQVFVPAGSKLTDTKNLQSKVDTVAGADHTDFVTLTEIKFDSTERFQFLYTTTPLVETFGPYRRYRLLLQKQPGMLGEAANVQVTLPVGAKIVSTSPQPAASYNLGQPVLEFRVQLTTDQWIELIYTD
jgi:hypothetical protein